MTQIATISDKLVISGGQYDQYHIEKFNIKEDGPFKMTLVRHKIQSNEGTPTIGIKDSVEISLDIQHVAELILNHAL